ncbi:MAG: hypothetical protein H0T48_13790 [Gemmatimonadaceae bacterium]|nr:hypothetical protein [Gemmatimonadaceae bacterium]
MPEIPQTVAVSITVVGVGLFLVSMFLIVKKEIAYRAGGGTLANESDRPEISIGGSVGDRTVIGHDNVVDHSTTINEAPPPGLRILGREAHKLVREGAYTSAVLVEVVSPYPAKRLSVTARNKDLMSVALIPTGTVAMMGGGSALRDGKASEYVDSASGKYWVRLVTSSPTETDLEFALD